MLNEWIYLSVATILNTIFQFFLKKKLNPDITISSLAILLIFLGSFFAAWGMDVIQRGLEVQTFLDELKVGLGCWLMFYGASVAKHYQLNGRSLKEYRNETGSDLIGFLLMSTIIFLLS